MSHYTLQSENQKARAGEILTENGVILTPAFMPVGTQGAVKSGVSPQDLKEVGSQIMLSNTYHLHLRPGEEIVEEIGGIQEFTGYRGPILTDSGGYQVFSLSKMRKMDKEGVTFRSHIDGKKVRFTPEEVMRIEHTLGADIIMCLDECPPHDAPTKELEAAVKRTTDWAQKCKEAHQKIQKQKPKNQSLYGIVQGGIDIEMRKRSLREIVHIGFDGYALGGLSVGEENEDMYRVLEAIADLMPKNCTRYLMGVGTLQDLTEGVANGIDIFDCVLPSRNARHGIALMPNGEQLKITREEYARDPRPLNKNCECKACSGYSRAALRHWLKAGEALAGRILTLHNLCVYHRHMSIMREQIIHGTFYEWRKAWWEEFRNSQE